ncbi:MAG: hypothetical protein ABR613_12745 [Actinomycetota bacterium]
MSAFTSSGTENRMMWDRRAAGFMEVWYATAFHRSLRSGLWVRYTITAPAHARGGDPSCRLWAFYFDPEGKRSFAGSTAYSGDRLGSADGRDDGALVRIADAWLSETHLEGRVVAAERSLSWSLDFDPAGRCFQHLPPGFRNRAARRFSTVCSPNLSVGFTGAVELDGETIRYDGEPGCQSHRWGRRNSHSWAWAHCSQWDDGGDAVFEGVTARAVRRLPPFTSLYLRHRGEDLAFADVRSALRARSRFELPTWAFSSHNARWKVAGAARLKLDRSVQVRYDDPDGGVRHCANSEIADLALEVYERVDGLWRHDASLTAMGSAHLEFGRPEPFPELPVAF